VTVVRRRKLRILEVELELLREDGGDPDNPDSPKEEDAQ
jgi:hypothetical protein